MKIMRVCMLTVTLLLLAPLWSSAVRAETLSGRVITGELVPTNASRNQFRIVGHGGSFTAPAGISVEALDGKPVQVEFGRDGRVLQISEEPVHINRIVHGEETISGQLVVNDPVMRTFTFAGDDQFYRAPPDIDIRSYAGRMVEVRLDEDGQVTSIAAATGTRSAPNADTCLYDGQSYSDGAPVCQNGLQYRCELGMWRDLGTACASRPSSALPALQGCTVGSATVASGSSVCRRGTTFRCSDGTWVNVGTACS